MDNESTATFDPGSEPSRRTSHPKEIGPYRILEVLGEGGMGIVYLAEQQKPIQRRVALKLIKLGMDTSEVIARFAAERQALALMNSCLKWIALWRGLESPPRSARPPDCNSHNLAIALWQECRHATG